MQNSCNLSDQILKSPKIVFNFIACTSVCPLIELVPPFQPTVLPMVVHIMEPGGGGEDVAVVSAAASANLGLTEDSSTTSSRSSSWPYEATSSSAASLPPPPGSPPPIIPHQLPHPSVVHSHPSIPLPPPPSSNIAGHQQPSSPTSSSAAAAAVTLSSIAASEAAAAAAAIDIDTYFRGSNGFFAPVQNTYTNGEFIFSRLPSMACRYLFALCYETVLYLVEMRKGRCNFCIFVIH